MTIRIFLKLIVGVMSVLLVALVAADWLASRVTERAQIDSMRRDLAEEARTLTLFDAAHQPPIRELARAVNARITRIDRSGRVLADSEADGSQMENHASRPEVRAALSGSVGSDTRESATIGVQFLYVAVPLAGGGALRVAVPLEQVHAQVREVTRQVLLAIVLAFVPATILAAFFARSVSRKMAMVIRHAGKLAGGDFVSRLPVGRSDELGILAEMLNVTGAKLKQMVDELDAEHQKLESLERVRKDFIINVSHELRTPLASIQGYTETLIDGAIYDPEHNLRFLGIIRSNVERLGRLVADLMTLAQLELKRTILSFADHSTKNLIAACVESMLPVAKRKEISIEIDIDDKSNRVYCDSEAVHQILSNLLDNAIKYTPEHGQITVGSRARPEDRVEIYVADTGIGIPVEDIPRLFERFYRVDKARSREIGGTGLGLSIVKHLALAHGGTVWVESELGKGSKFSFVLAAARNRIGDELPDGKPAACGSSGEVMPA